MSLFCAIKDESVYFSLKLPFLVILCMLQSFRTVCVAIHVLIAFSHKETLPFRTPKKHLKSSFGFDRKMTHLLLRVRATWCDRG